MLSVGPQAKTNSDQVQLTECLEVHGINVVNFQYNSIYIYIILDRFKQACACKVDVLLLVPDYIARSMLMIAGIVKVTDCFFLRDWVWQKFGNL